MLISTLVGVREIPKLYFDVASSFGAPRWQIVWRILIPGSAPSVLAGARLAANLAFVITLSIELIFGERGIGRVIWFSWQTLRTDELFATLAVTALIGLFINSLLLAIARHALPWKTLSRTS